VGVGKTAESIFPRETGAQIQQKIGQVIFSGEQSYHIVEQQDDQRLKYLEARYLPFGKNEVLVLISDITTQKQTEERLRISNESFQNVFNLMPEAVFVLDETGVILQANRSAETRFQLTNEKLAGKTLENFSGMANNFEEINRIIRHVAETGEESGFDFRRTGKDGREVFEEIRINKAGFFGQSVLIAVAHDWTEKHLAEENLKLRNQELLTLNAEKDKFFSIIAHDLRSPFNSFLGLTQLMAEDLDNMSFSEIKTIVVSMGKSADSLYGLLENLLEWSRFQRGMISFSPKEFRLENKAKETLRSMVDSANRKGIELNIAIPEHVFIRADEYMLGSVLRNLTSNAIKFTSKGGKITLSAKPIHDGFVELVVADNGIGMDSDMVHKLFNPNEYTNRQGTEGELSSGLGLVLCKEFIEKHQGKIWVESEVGKGSAFHVTIPGGQ
jgi:PAS domain S-box-containing protein